MDVSFNSLAACLRQAYDILKNLQYSMTKNSNKMLLLFYFLALNHSLDTLYALFWNQEITTVPDVNKQHLELIGMLGST